MKRQPHAHLLKTHQTRAMAAEVACPACAAPPGVKCMTANMIEAANPHRLRIEAARRARAGQ